MAVVQKYAFADELAHTLQEEVVWDIETDLHMMASNYQRLLEDYFKQMIHKNNMKQTDAHTAAISFIYIIDFGYFLLKTRMNSIDDAHSTDTFLQKNIQNYIDSLVFFFTNSASMYLHIEK